MSTTRFLSLAVAVTALLTSCFHSPDKLSSATVVQQYNALLKRMAENAKFVEVPVGTTEVNSSSSRLQLRQMQAAGLVTYNVTRYPWWEKGYYTYSQPYTVRHSFWGYAYDETAYRTVRGSQYNFEDHYVVNIGLTRKGQALVVESLPQAQEKVDRDLVPPTIDESKYAWNKVDLTETWPEIPNPFVTPTPPRESGSTGSSSGSTSGGHSSGSSGSTPDNIERIDINVYNAYKALNLDGGTVYMKSYSLKAVKARNIQISKTGQYPKAVAEVIIKTCGTTDAGRILDGAENGYKLATSVTLTYYWDKGWVLDEKND